MIDRIVAMLIRHPGKCLAALLVLTLAVAPLIGRLPFVFEITEMFATDDPAVEPTQKFRELFGRDDTLVQVAWQEPKVFEPATLRKIDRISQSLKNISGVDGVLSLTTAETITGADGALGLEKWLDVKRLDQIDLEAVQRQLNADPLWRRVLVDPAGTVPAIVIRLEEDVNNDEGREPILAAINEIFAAEKVDMHLGGVPVIRSIFVDRMKHDIRMFIPSTIVLAMVLTYLLFRSFRPVYLMFWCPRSP